jgi:dTDP-4-amino-4,6-dideoxygalactose transaminase
MMAVPLLDLRAQYHSMKPQIDHAVMEVLESGQFILGPAVERFENAFAAFCGTRHAIGVNSGTSALHLALLAAGVGPGDEVITVPMTFVATVAAILYTGARPVFVDIDPVTHLMDPELIEAAITRRTKAILPVHLHGLMADMDAINLIAEAHGLTVRTRPKPMARNSRQSGRGALDNWGVSVSIRARTWARWARGAPWSPMTRNLRRRSGC